MNASESLAWAAKNKVPLKIIAERCPGVSRSKLAKWRQGGGVAPKAAREIAGACASIVTEIRQAMIGAPARAAR